MGVVKIDYSKLEDAARDAKTLSEYYDNCSVDLTNKVSNKLNINSGNDAKGYIGSAQSAVSKQIKILNGKYSKLSKDIYSTQSSIQNHEINAKKNVTKIATDKLGLNDRKWYQVAGDWIYGTVCVDLVNMNPLTRGIGNLVKRGRSYLRNKFDKVVDWFKHGNGKYILNIATSVLGDAIAIIGTYSAIVLAAGATVASGGVALPLLIAAIASGVGTAMTIGDSFFTMYNNAKALNNSTDPGRARYYGNIDGFSSAVKKYDLGDKSQNDIWNNVATGYDTTHTIADITSFVAGGIGKAGLTESEGVRTIYDKTKVKDNLSNTFKEKIGFRKQRGTGKYKWDFKNLISTKDPTRTSALGKQNLMEDRTIRQYLGNKNTHKRQVYEKIQKSSKYLSKPIKIKGVIDNVDNLRNSDSNAYSKAKSTTKIISNISDVSGKKWRIVSPIKDVNSSIIPIIDMAK